MSTFVTVGNARQPFVRLLDAVSRHAARLPQPVVVQYGHTPFKDEQCECVQFVGMEDFIHHIKTAELLIMHGGLGSAINALQAHKVPIVMSRRVEYGEHVNNHQIEFVQLLAKDGKIVPIESEVELLPAIERVRTLQQRPDSAPSLMDSPVGEPKLVQLVRLILNNHASVIGGKRITPES